MSSKQNNPLRIELYCQRGELDDYIYIHWTSTLFTNPYEYSTTIELPRYMDFIANVSLPSGGLLTASDCVVTSKEIIVMVFLGNQERRR